MIYVTDPETAFAEPETYEADPVKRALMDMRDEFESHVLLVGLAPAPSPRHEGHMVRVLCDQNPRWYRVFCSKYLSTRRRNKSAHDTKIRRANTARALAALIEGKNGGIYGEDLLSIARERAGNEPF